MPTQCLSGTSVLHILTTDVIVARPNFVRTASELLDIVGPRGALHLRTRQLAGKEYVSLCRTLARVAREAGAALIVNERVDVAMAADVDGVQLGSSALKPGDVHRVAPQLYCGVSVHSVDEVRSITKTMQPGAVDWFIAGHVFETASHPGQLRRGVSFLQQIARATTIPIIAVGGITPERVSTVIEAGAVGVAAISGIWELPEPKIGAIRYLSNYADCNIGGGLGVPLG